MPILMIAAAGLALQPSKLPQSAQANTTVTPAQAGRRVEIAPGRSLNILCIGNGKHTILFDAGGSDWSVIWATILPRLAGSARACAYDRAGLGSSDPATGDRTPFAIAEDMRRLIRAAGLKTPLVLVGHSLGGFNVKLYAALYPEDVAGLVLVDPAEERVWDRTRDWAIGAYGHSVAARSELLDQYFIAGLVERYRRCAATAASNGLDANAPDYRRCADPPRPALGAAINADRQKVHVTPAYQVAQASEIAFSVYADPRSNGAYARLFQEGLLGSKPLIVLTHEEPASKEPLDQLSASQGLMLHRETARLSRRGRHQLVRNSGHYIQLDQPDVLIQAIESVLEQIE